MAGIPLYEGHKYKLVEDNPENLHEYIHDEDDKLGIMNGIFGGVRWCYYVDLGNNKRVPDINGYKVAQPLRDDKIQELLDEGKIESFEPFVPNDEEDD